MTVREVLEDAGAIRRGEFTLSSGRTSSLYVDVKEAATRPEPLRKLADALAARVPDDVDGLACVALGGVPLGVAVALATDLPYVVVRKSAKDHGTEDRIVGSVPGGATLCLVEDVTTTGRSAVDAVRVLRDAGYRVGTCLVVVDRGEGAEATLADADVTLTPLVDAEELGDDPS